MPRYTAAVSTAKLTLTDRLRGRLIHKPGVDELKREISDVFYTPPVEVSFTSVTLRWSIERFSEQFVADVEFELAAYFNFRSGRALEVAYPDLLYFGGDGADYSFNKSVAAAIGEGLAGFLVQRIYGFVPQARPLGLSPDLIMERGGDVAFVEAKATLATVRGSLGGIVNDAAVDLMKYLSIAPYLKQAIYSGFVVGTELLDANRFESRILEIAQ